MKIKICNDNIVEVKFSVMQTFPETKSLVIVNGWKIAAKFSVQITKMK